MYGTDILEPNLLIESSICSIFLEGNNNSVVVLKLNFLAAMFFLFPFIPPRCYVISIIRFIRGTLNNSLEGETTVFWF